MKKITALALICLMLAGCTPRIVATAVDPTPEPAPSQGQAAFSESLEYKSRFPSETRVILSDDGVTVDGENGGVYTSHDIIYYEDRESYDSGNPYGEGELWEKHTAEEAEAHTVVNITAPGAYRLSGKLSAGQLRIDLGEDARDNPEAAVELILDGVDITCTVAPAILFLNVYECDGDQSEETASPQIDTAAAGANLILRGDNSVTGSHVARIYQDNDKEKKLWKQDGAIYSYMSMNVFGPGRLALTADNEGLDTELHLTVNGGEIIIRANNDGINTNEDGVSVTTINGGTLHIIAGLGKEGDGIDSNGYLVINGGTVVSFANPASDAGLDSDLGSYIHGGTVIALGSAMNWAESGSRQVTMNLQFAAYQESDSAIVAEAGNGSVVFAYDPGKDTALGENRRQYQGAVVSCAAFRQGETYRLYSGGVLTGEESDGIYASITDYDSGIPLGYTGTDVGRGFGGFHPGRPENEGPPKNPDVQRPEGDFPEPMPDREKTFRTNFLMTDRVNAFSGISPAEG